MMVTLDMNLDEELDYREIARGMEAWKRQRRDERRKELSREATSVSMKSGKCRSFGMFLHNYMYHKNPKESDMWKNAVIILTYMWTLPHHQGGSLKWALKFLLKHTTCYQNFKISLIWIKNFPIYSIHFWKTSLKWKERKISLMPFCNLSHVCPKTEQYGFTIEQSVQKDGDKMANSVDPDQTISSGAVWSASTQFAQTCQSVKT